VFCYYVDVSHSEISGNPSPENLNLPETAMDVNTSSESNRKHENTIFQDFWLKWSNCGSGGSQRRD
jgi:hypothetical protein